MIIQSLTEGIMSHFFRRFLSTVMLSAMLACTAFSPLSTAVVYANAESVKAAAFRGTEAEPLVDPDDESASSVRDEKDGAGINTDVIQEDQLIYSHGKYRYRLSNGKYLKRSWKTIGNKTYYFNKKGYALKGLQKIGNYYYIFSSKGVLKKGWIKSDKKPALNPDLWETLLALTDRHEIHCHWVKGHADNEYNNRCDAMAVREREKFQ